MQEAIKKAAEILAQTDIPNIPEEVLQLKAELNKKFPNTVTIANLISKNPEMLANFLNLVNTGVTDEKTEIKDAKAAVNLLGLDEIYNIFLATTLTSLLAQNPFEREILLQGSKAGLAAAELSYWVYDISRSEAYMAGLMQNIGALYLSRAEKEEYEEIFNGQSVNPITAYEKEMETYKTSHCFLGGIVSKKWHVDPAVYKAILFHHDTDFAIKTAGDQKIKHLIALTIVGNYIVSVNDHEQYITQELKDYRNLGKAPLDLPDNALKAATSAVQKWGHKAGLAVGSH